MTDFNSLFDFLYDFRGMTKDEQELCHKIFALMYRRDNWIADREEAINLQNKLSKFKKVDLSEKPKKKKKKDSKFTVHCQVCNKKIRTYNINRKYCSHKCQGKAMEGIPRGPYPKKRKR